MRAIDLEARVITAVDQIRSGKPVEHDYIECKRSWPQEQKARQLAGSLNRAGGDPVVYIIGIDEKTGDVHDVSDTDILDWWTQIVPQFDQAPPELVRHLNVQVGEGGEHVVAVAVASDRAPYVVKSGKGNQGFEVPMREGTGTRSARRDELLRMLIPTTKLPEVIALEGYLEGGYRPAVGKATPEGRQFDQEEELSISGGIRVFLAHNGRETVTLPTHGMSATVWIDDESYSVIVKPNVSEKQADSNAAPIPTRDAITVTTSGAVTLMIASEAIPPSKIDLFRGATLIRLEAELEVLGAVRAVRMSVEMQRTKGAVVKNHHYERLGRWAFEHSGLS